MDMQTIEALKLVLEACKDVGGDAATVAIWYFVIPLIQTLLYVGVVALLIISVKRLFTSVVSSIFNKEPVVPMTKEEHDRHIQLLKAEVEHSQITMSAKDIINHFCVEELGYEYTKLKIDRIKHQIYMHDLFKS